MLLQYYSVSVEEYPGGKTCHGILCDGRVDVSVTFLDNRPRRIGPQGPTLPEGNKSEGEVLTLALCWQDYGTVARPCEGHHHEPSQTIELHEIRNGKLRALLES